MVGRTSASVMCEHVADGPRPGKGSAVCGDLPGETIQGTTPVRQLPRASFGDLDPGWQIPQAITSWRRGIPLELVRYAGVNRLRVEVDYRPGAA
jgi:hypothetical protein